MEKLLGKAKQRRLNFGNDFMKYFSFSAIVLLLIGFSATQKNFLGNANLTTLLRDTAPLMIMATGMTMVLIFGSIDLSMGAVCSVSNVLFVKFSVEFGGRLPSVGVTTLCALLLSLGFGMLAGFLLGFIHVKLKVPSFIASLGFMSVWQSTALLLSEAPLAVPKAMWGAIDWYKVSVGVVGLPLILAVIIVLTVYVFSTKTTFGKAVFAIGGNERAARMAGMAVDRTKILVFTVGDMCAALGGVFLAAKIKSCSPSVGDSFTLLIVASVVLGGTSLTGGRGSVLGTILGVFTVAIIQNGMNFIGVDAYWQNVVFGIFVLAAIAVSVDRTTRGLIVK